MFVGNIHLICTFTVGPSSATRANGGPTLLGGQNSGRPDKDLVINACLMVGQIRRRWPNIKSALIMA